MSWRVIFTGALALLLAVAVGGLAIVIREEYPWLSAVTVLADLGIIVGGLKSVLDTTKTANELRKMGFEVEKLKLEIAEKRQAAEKQDSRIVVATLDEIQIFSGRIPVQAQRRQGSAIYLGSTALLVVMFAGLLGSVFLSQRKATMNGRQTESSIIVGSAPQPTGSAPRPTGSAAPPAEGGNNELADEMRLRLFELSHDAALENEYWDGIRKQIPKGMSISLEIAANRQEMNVNLNNAKHAFKRGEYGSASHFADLAEKYMEILRFLK